MGLLQAMIAAFALYVLLHLYILPRLYRRLPQARLADAYKQIARVLLAEIVHAATLIAGLSLATILVAIWLLSQMSGHVSQAQLGAMYEFTQWLRERISAISEWWGIGAIVLLCLMLTLQLKNEAKRKFGSAVDAAVKKLNADIEAGKLPELPETEEMKAASAAIDVRKKMIADILARSNAEGGDKAKADPEQNPELAKLVAEAQALSQYRFELDMRRRLDLGGQLAGEAPPTRNVFLSREFLRLVNGTTRVLSLLSLALLIPALVAVTGPQISGAAFQASVELHDLILKNSLAEAKASWENGIGHSDKERELNPQDQDLIKQLSQRYAHLIYQQYGASIRVPSETIRSFRQFAARETILHDFALAHPAPSAAQAVSGELAKQKALVDAMTSIQSNNALANGVAEGFGNDLTTRAKTSDPASWQNFRAKAALALKAVPPEAAQADAIASKLFGEILNTAGRAVGVPGADNAIQLLAENLFEPGGLVERARELNRLNQYRFLNEVLTHGNVDMPAPALVPDKVPLYGEPEKAELRKVATALDNRLTAANDAWAEHPPTLPTPAHGGQDLAVAERQISELLKKPGAQGLREVLPDTLATYGDYFPGVLGEETRTPRAALMTSAVRVEESTASAMRTAFVRARSYGALRGFAKIGGVLIGLAPNDGKGPNIVDLQWESRDDGVRLKLTRNDGTILSYGPFRAELIRLALAYAADGRLVTVTMPAAEVGRKILMHPALLDSALGCEARQLDQFVDAFAAPEKDSERKNATDLVQRHLVTYYFAWAAQFKRLTSQNTLPPIPPDYLNRTSEQADHILSNTDIRNNVERTLGTPEAWRNSTLSPVTLKPDYFEQRLVETAGRCLTSGGDAEAFRKCVAAAPLDRNYTDSLEWALPPPFLFSESGVREQAYTLGPDLEFLDLNRPRAATWPFSFIIQVTFETPPSFARDREKSFDEHPFEYPALKSWIDQRVTLGIATTRAANFDAPRVMKDMREFTVLQRLFRLAFEGKLGDQFPFEALVGLSKVQPRKAIAAVRTPVWNYPEATKELLQQSGLTSLSAPLGLDRDLETHPDQREGCPIINP
jgi:hypothetical protein